MIQIKDNRVVNLVEPVSEEEYYGDVQLLRQYNMSKVLMQYIKLYSKNLVYWRLLK